MNNEKKQYFMKRFFQYIQISIGVIVLNIGFFFFLEPTGIVTGGVLGISILLEPFFNQIGSWFTTSVFLYISNIITLIIGGIFLGKDFFIKTIYASILSPTIILILEHTTSPNFFLDYVSNQGYYVIALICGTILSGIGIGIAIKNNGSTGGIDVIQKIMSKYMHIPMSKTIYLTDWVIVFISGFHFLGGFFYDIELVIYGSISVVVSSYIIDRIVLNAKTKRTAYIITDKPEEIRDMIYHLFSRGVTFCNVEGAYSKKEKIMVICTLDKNEAYRLKDMIQRVDSLAFTFITLCQEVVGEYERGKKYGSRKFEKE